jgi:hypothetical protein
MPQAHGCLILLFFVLFVFFVVNFAEPALLSTPDLGQGIESSLSDQRIMVVA